MADYALAGPLSRPGIRQIVRRAVGDLPFPVSDPVLAEWSRLLRLRAARHGISWQPFTGWAAYNRCCPSETSAVAVQATLQRILASTPFVINENRVAPTELYDARLIDGPYPTEPMAAGARESRATATAATATATARTVVPEKVAVHAGAPPAALPAGGFSAGTVAPEIVAPEIEAASIEAASIEAAGGISAPPAGAGAADSLILPELVDPPVGATAGLAS